MLYLAEQNTYVDFFSAFFLEMEPDHGSVLMSILLFTGLFYYFDHMANSILEMQGCYVHAFFIKKVATGF